MAPTAAMNVPFDAGLKDIKDQAPSWASTIKVPMEEKTTTALLCQYRDTLIYIANLGCIEINVWDSSAGSLKE
jgi:bifunctional non-homologous end joining protein LigD